MITLYHNPRCAKSREALALLEARGHKPNLILYIANPPTTKTLKVLLTTLKMSPRDLLRKSEASYKALKLDDLGLSDSALIKAMAENPTLIERPIAINGAKAVIGRPPENVLSIL